jgi:hypothetical protein
MPRTRTLGTNGVVGDSRMLYELEAVTLVGARMRQTALFTLIYYL